MTGFIYRLNMCHTSNKRSILETNKRTNCCTAVTVSL